ncbi:Mu transposase C-terminal domain-containing protein [Deinococcus rubellus]|uniref:Mu transposase C-terminal domain-containing protein n=1 Tax=Deinococcus rubellus TaxID=1889240 RepID=UPI0031E5A90A
MKNQFLPAVYLHRLGVKLICKNRVQERFLRLLDVSVQVRAVDRGTVQEVYLPDGTQATYTPDFMVTLHDGRHISVICPPTNQLPDLFELNRVTWQARAARLEQLGQPLHVVTEHDLPPIRLRQAMLFSAHFGVPVDTGLQQRILNWLSERGKTPLAALRLELRDLSACSLSAVDNALYTLLARHSLIADVTADFPESAIALPGQGIVWPPPPVGAPVSALLHDPDWARQLRKSTPVPEHRNPGERRALATKRGQRLLKLFQLMPDPRVPLDDETAQLLGTQLGCSVRSVHRYRHSLLAAGAPGITAAELGTFLGGPSQPRRQIAGPVAVLIERLAAQCYFVPLGTPARARSMADLHQLVRKACLAEELPPPAYNTVKAAVKRLEARDPLTAHRRRHGATSAQALQDRQGRLHVRFYGELIAIDCTPCDVMTVDDQPVLVPVRAQRGKGQRRRGAQRPTLVMVVDVATTQVLRSAVVAGAPSAAVILNVLQTIFLGNTQNFTAQGVMDVPQGQGLPRRIRMDSGTEFVNAQVARVLSYLRIEVVPRNSGTRHLGGIEERTIGISSHAQHVSRGTTSNNATNRGDYDPVNGAGLSLDELNRYQQTATERHNQLCAPLQILTRQAHAESLIQNGMSAWRPLSAAEETYVRNRMHPQEIRTCQRAGIELLGLRYVAPQLGPLIVRRARVEVSFDPEDVREIRVIHPDTGELITASAHLTDWMTSPLTMSCWTLMKRAMARSKQLALDHTPTLQQLYIEATKVREPSQNSPRAHGASATGDLPASGPSKIQMWDGVFERVTGPAT